MSRKKIGERFREVNNRSDEFYKLQRRVWIRQLQGHLISGKPGKERESKNDLRNDTD